MADIDYAAAENFDSAQDFIARRAFGLNLDEHHFPFHSRHIRFRIIHYLNDGDNLVQLLHDLFENHAVAVCCNRHARGIFLKGGGDIEGINIKAAAGKQAGHTGQHARFVFNQHGKNMSFHFRALPLDQQHFVQGRAGRNDRIDIFFPFHPHIDKGRIG